MSEDWQFAQFDRALQLMEWRRWKEAIQETESYIHSFPEDADGYALLGKIHLHLDEYDKAFHWGEEALRKAPENELGWEVCVGALYSKKSWKHFGEMVAEALRLFPYEDHFYYLRGNFFNMTGRLELAKADFEEALRIDPENGLYLATYSYNLTMLGEFDEALMFEKRALEEDVENYLTFMYLAWANDQRGNFQQALIYIENAIRINPEGEQVRSEYMAILQKQYRFYQWLLWPSKLSQQKPWVVFVIFLITWFLFKPLIIVFIVLYGLTHWLTKLLVHVKIFGLHFRK